MLSILYYIVIDAMQIRYVWYFVSYQHGWHSLSR